MNRPTNHRDAGHAASDPGNTTLSVPYETPQPAESLRDAKQKDELLQIFRRLDWRFLLPDPTLRHVAFLGDDDAQLTQGLRRASGTLSLLDLHWRFAEGQEPRFDTVVLRTPRLADAERASRLVQPGGCLYWEIAHRPLSPGDGSLRERFFPQPDARLAPRNPARLRRHLQKLGFTNVRFYWHRPSFREAVEIIPLEDEGILHFVLDGRGARLSGRVKRLGARWLRRLGLLRGLVPHMSVIACKRQHEEEA